MSSVRMSQRAAQGPLSAGDTFLSKYEIKDLIGQGGHACVYHAINTFMGREVAIKVLHRPGGIDRESLRRGQAEAQLLNRLRHHNIVEVIDAGMTETGLLYIVMELLRGRSLRDVLNEHGALSVEEVLDLAAQAADGVHSAHITGAIHRDLKPENLFVTRDQGLKILDFGIAKVADATNWTTDKDVAHGTVLYMSPEQLQLHKLTPRSDIYALGVIMYEALLGRHPISELTDAPHPSMWEISRAVLSVETPLLDEVDARVPRNVALLVSRAMAKAPEQRFSSMEEFARAIRECAAAWAAYAHVHGLDVGVRELATPGARRRTAPLVPLGTPGLSAPHGAAPGAPVASFGGTVPLTPRTERLSAPAPASPSPSIAPSTQRVITPGTAAPVTTGLYSRDWPSIPGERPNRVRQVLLLSGLIGASVGGTVAFMHFTSSSGLAGQPDGIAISAAPSLSPSASMPTAPPSGLPARAPDAPAAASSAPTSTASATAPAPIAAPPRSSPREVPVPRPAKRTTAPAPAAAPPTSRPKPATPDPVEERLRRLEKSLGGG